MTLETALAALPDSLREAFILVKAEGLTYREAAAALEIPQGTVQFRVHEASKRLQVLLNETDVTVMNTPRSATCKGGAR